MFFSFRQGMGNAPMFSSELHAAYINLLHGIFLYPHTHKRELDRWNKLDSEQLRMIYYQKPNEDAPDLSGETVHEHPELENYVDNSADNT